MPQREEYPAIEPVAAGIHRPLWSVMIPTYNCAEYLKVTLRSVLEQDPGPEQMQIEVIDDCSTKDDPEAVVKELGRGRVAFYRHPQNVGAQTNFNACIQRAHGHLVHILHGDDAVLPGFYRRLQEAFEKESTVGAAFCRYITIDEQGNHQGLMESQGETAGLLTTWLERIAVFNHLFFPSIAVKRSAYEKLGGFHPELFHTSDWDMWKRIAVHFPVWYEPEALALYRIHSASDTSRLIRTGANIVDSRKAIEIAESYLPEAIAAELSNKARKHLAFYAISTARRMLSKGDTAAAIAQIREALKCSHSYKVVYGLIYSLVGAAIDRTRMHHQPDVNKT